MFSSLLSMCPIPMFSVCPCVHTLFDNLSTGIYQWISLKFWICICIDNVLLGIIAVQIFIISDRAMAQKWVMATSSFTIWSIMIKLHKNDQSNILY